MLTLTLAVDLSPLRLRPQPLIQLLNPSQRVRTRQFGTQVMKQEVQDQLTWSCLRLLAKLMLAAFSVLLAVLLGLLGLLGLCSLRASGPAPPQTLCVWLTETPEHHRPHTPSPAGQSCSRSASFPPHFPAGSDKAATVSSAACERRRPVITRP